MKLIKKSPWAFIILIGIISLFSDMTHEGARSITGPYLAMLGASATIVGFVAGFGELIGYSLRLVSWFIADKTKKYWTVTFIGYFINLLAVPALALAGSWPMAAVLMIWNAWEELSVIRQGIPCFHMPPQQSVMVKDLEYTKH
jgi:hypothetical protein